MMTTVRKKRMAQLEPMLLSRKPKSQLKSTLQQPLAKRRIPETLPGELGTRSQPIVMQVAKRGERPMVASAIAKVAIRALGLNSSKAKPSNAMTIQIIAMRHEPRRKINQATTRRLSMEKIKVILLRAAAMPGVCAKTTCK